MSGLEVRMRKAIAECYPNQPGEVLAVDKLPYTDNFDWLVEQVRRRSGNEHLTHHAVWTLLLAMRKDETLPTLKRERRKTAPASHGAGLGG